MSAWIKMRVDLTDDPSVVQIALSLGVDEDLVVGKLHRLWSWADRQTTDGHAAGVTGEWIDRHVSVPGFAAAMVHAGWLEITETGLVFPNFTRHNGASAKKRALTATRNAALRERRDASVTPARRSRDACVTLDASPREDKIREEKEKNHLLPQMVSVQAAAANDAHWAWALFEGAWGDKIPAAYSNPVLILCRSVEADPWNAGGVPDSPARRRELFIKAIEIAKAEKGGNLAEFNTPATAARFIGAVCEKSRRTGRVPGINAVGDGIVSSEDAVAQYRAEQARKKREVKRDPDGSRVGR